MDKKEINLQSIVSNNISIESNKISNSLIKKKSLKELEILKLFCSDIKRINEKDECNWTPLYRSIISGNIESTEVLLNNGADPNIQCSMGETSLYQAVDMEKIEHVKLLLKHGANPNISQIDGLSSLHLAVLKQNIIIIKNLLKYKANPNKQSSLYLQTPVHLAIKNNVDSMILLILANYGGSLTIKDKFGKKPIDYIKSNEMRKTVELLKLEINNENFIAKKIYFTPSKNNKLAITNVISKTIKSVSPKSNGLKAKSNIITLKDSGKSKFNFIEIKSGEKKIENENKKNDINDNLKINLFYQKSQDIKSNNQVYKQTKFIYKKEKLGNIKNKSLNNSNFNNYKFIESPIQEEPSSIISTNKYFKKIKETKDIDNYCKNENKNYSPFSKSSSQQKRKNNNSVTHLQSKYIRKKSTDKISAFKCESNKKITNNHKRNNTEEIKSRKIYSNKNIQNSRNSKNILLGEIINKNGNFLTNNSITNSLTDTLTNYKTQLSTNSNKALKDKNSSFHNIKEDKNNIRIQAYNKPKVLTDSIKINPYRNKRILLENPLIRNKIMRNRNKNFFNSKNNTLRHYPTNKLISLINKEQKEYKFINNDKENISSNIGNSFLSITSRNSINGKIFNKNSYNSSQSLCTYYTYTKNDNNSLLEVVEKTRNVIYKKETLPIYKWLKEIDLLVYLPLFIKKKIFSFHKIISDLKSKKIIINPNNIRKIGIEIPGHIYRIFVKLELDADLIDKKIYEYLLFLKKEEIKKKKEEEESSQSLYDCCGVGCCSLKRTHIKIRVDKDDRCENKIFLDLEKWLKNINMIKYKENFIKSGFDKIEFFILQMFSSIPLEEKIFEKELNIENNNDIDLFILQLNKDVKLISNKFKKKRSSSVEVDKKAVSKYLLNKENNSRKKLTRTSSNVCAIF